MFPLLGKKIPRIHAVCGGFFWHKPKRRSPNAADSGCGETHERPVIPL